ncbi:MAG: biphenyl 2,3-dioxygenase, partial [Clostridia bacterium]|nr:biphenyl 2,3-dioxygenase [Deltaproteobacteria bacterium]
MSFTFVFIAFAAMAFYLLLERDRVAEDYRTAIRVSITYLAIAAVNYFYMWSIYAAGVAAGQT